MLCRMIDKQISDGRRFRPPPDWILRENKWRASRHGVEARLIVNEEGDTELLRRLTERLFADLAGDTKELKYENEIALLRRVLAEGPSYSRQKSWSLAFNEDRVRLTDMIATEFENETPIWAPQT